MCIIINNCNFEGATERRDGSEHDVDRMQSLFKRFQFNCFVHTDKTVHEMKQLLFETAKSIEHGKVDCLVVILMSHGDQDTIQGVDGKDLNLVDDVYQQFNNEECPGLQEKPKVFFIQACRGKSGGGAVADDTADSREEPAEMLQRRRRMATWSDMYIAYATIPGYKALRNKQIGSWFLSAVYTVFSEHANTLHLDDLMKGVHREILQKCSDNGASQTPTVERQGWRKQLYFIHSEAMHRMFNRSTRPFMDVISF
ncbi:hypothetical protein MTO96_052365 [Rhipicephalus appendiculatus]